MKMVNEDRGFRRCGDAVEASALDEMAPQPKMRSRRRGGNGASESDVVSLYLSDIGRTSLLTPTEEVELARAMERGRKAACILSRNGHGPERAARLKRDLARGDAARKHLIEANLRLVVNVAKGYAGRGVPLADLIQEGTLGLMHAVERFNFRLGHRFSTYATWWVHQAIGRAVLQQGRTIRLPIHLEQAAYRLRRAAEDLARDLGRDPTTEELAAEVGLPPHHVKHLLGLPQVSLSLQMPVGDESEHLLGEFIENDGELEPADVASQHLLQEQIEKALAALTPREARVLELRYGLSGKSPHTLQQVGAKFGLTRERIRQIETGALARLRHPRWSRQLKGYL